MLAVITVHHKTTEWLEIQLGYLKRHIPCRWMLFIDINVDFSCYDLKDLSGAEVVHVRVSRSGIKLHHRKKLSFLTVQALSISEIDTLLFLDGDAFPITSISPFLEKLPQHNLIAVQRSVDLNESFPHPCFALVNVDWWKRLRGTWLMGKKKVEAFGKRIERTTNWLPLTKTGALTESELWFLVYGNAIYHHGAGFRVPIVYGYKGYQNMEDSQKLGESVFNDMKNDRINWGEFNAS